MTDNNQFEPVNPQDRKTKRPLTERPPGIMGRSALEVLVHLLFSWF